ncbi:hypothetical protein BHE74_00027129 [Ensete ventricosum]|nr:hypothetical protein BHE74_00027129 [Ensete ventricosum]
MGNRHCLTLAAPMRVTGTHGWALLLPTGSLPAGIALACRQTPLYATTLGRRRPGHGRSTLQATCPQVGTPTRKQFARGRCFHSQARTPPLDKNLQAQQEYIEQLYVIQYNTRS